MQHYQVNVLDCTVDREIFVVNKVSLVSYNDENKNHELFSTSNVDQNATLLVCRSYQNKAARKIKRQMFYKRKFLILRYL